MYAWLQAASLGLFVSEKRKGLEIRKRVLGNTLSDRMLILLRLPSHDASYGLVVSGSHSYKGERGGKVGVEAHYSLWFTGLREGRFLPNLYLRSKE